MEHLYAIRARETWAYLKTEDVLFWLINVYLFLEYVRPQTLYPALDLFPWTRTVILLTLFLYIVHGKKEWNSNPINKLLFLFLGIVLLSSTFAMSPARSFENLPVFISWLIIYFLIINIVNTEKRFLIFMLAFLLYSFKMAQFSFRGWVAHGFGFAGEGTGGGPGWFHNAGEFGIQMCIFLPLAFYFFLALREHWQKWKKGLFLLFPVFAITGTISSGSRGALLGAGAVMLWMFLKRSKRLKGLAILGAAAILIVTILPEEQKARLRAAGEEADRTSQTRLERWNKGLVMAAQHPVLGVGYANWGVADWAMFGGDGSLSHNIFVECMSELGYTGLAVFVLMILFTFANNYQTRKLATFTEKENRFIYYMAHGLDGALIGFITSGFFVTVLYYPYFWINLAMTVALNGVAKKLAGKPSHVKGS